MIKFLPYDHGIGKTNNDKIIYETKPRSKKENANALLQIAEQYVATKDQLRINGRIS